MTKDGEDGKWLCDMHKLERGETNLTFVATKEFSPSFFNHRALKMNSTDQSREHFL